MSSKRFPFYAAACLAAMGGLFVFGPLLGLLSRKPLRGYVPIGHWGVCVPGAVALPIIGIALIYLAMFVYHRRLLAAYASVAISLLIFGYLCILYPFRLVTLFAALLTAAHLILVIAGRRQFIVKNSLENLPRLLRPIISIALVGVMYGTLGFYALGKPLFHVQFPLVTSIEMAFDGLTGFSSTIDEPTRAGQFFIDSLGGIGIVVFVLLLEALFRPLRLKVLPHQEMADHRAAEALVRAYSTSSEDYFKLWPHDKQYFFSADQQAFLAYKPSGRTVVVLSDPVGNPASFHKLVTEFVAYCHSLGWLVAVINATSVSQRLFEPHGFGSIFIGNEGSVEVAQFANKTSRDKHFRYVRNKAARDGLMVEEWHELDDEHITALRAISNEWLSRRGRREYTFFMGYFDPAYLRQSRIFVLTQNGRPVAYINLIPSFNQQHASLDHFRSRGGISSVGMHFLLMRILEQLHDEQVETLNIGLSPLSGVQASDVRLLSKATLRLVRRFGSSYYSFQGLEQFKNKFRPSWEPRALVYAGASVGLLRMTNDIERAATYTPGNGRQFYISTVVGSIILAIGIYFILG